LGTRILRRVARNIAEQIVADRFEDIAENCERRGEKPCSPLMRPTHWLCWSLALALTLRETLGE
jgi:hypothetical protein